MRKITRAPKLQRFNLTRMPRRLFIGAIICSAIGSTFAKKENQRSYKTGYSDIMKLGRDLRAALPAEHRGTIAEQPISIETDNQPFSRLLYLKDGTKEVRGVWISAGFIDLINHVAHAQAIDRKVEGYFKRYVEMLESGGVPPLPNVDEPRFWTDEVLNEQQSNFNSIVGLAVGMKLAHHYLGLHDRYKEKDGEGIEVSLSEEEWREAFLHGVRNALRAGCMTEGAASFFQAMDRMKARPRWVQDFIHPKVKVASVRRQMEDAQRDYLAGEGRPERTVK